jgi:hypothetical protein
MHKKRLPPDDEIRELLQSAAAYLKDAANVANSPHTRFSSAMNSLGCVYAAGAGGKSDWEKVITWERARYDLAAAPSEAEIAEAIAHVRLRLGATKED